MRTLFNPFKEFNYFVEYDIKSNTATLEPYNILLLRGKKDIKKELEEKLLTLSSRELKSRLTKYFKARNLPIISPKKEYKIYAFSNLYDEKLIIGKITNLGKSYISIKDINDNVCRVRYENILEVEENA